MDEKGDGRLLKHSRTPGSQREEINGVCLSATVALCAKRPLVKHTPTHLAQAQGMEHNAFSPCLSLSLWDKDVPLGTTTLGWQIHGMLYFNPLNRDLPVN